jgi:molecular chaperone HtpG
VISRAYGSEEAWRWESEGVEGYTIEACQRENPGTDVIMTIKTDSDGEEYSKYLQNHTLAGLVRKYSDYIRYPIRMEMEKTRAKEKPEDAGEDDKPEYETIQEWETINSMVPLWQRPKAQVTDEEYQSFYREKFMDWEEPLVVSHIAAEGNLEYKALLYIPSRAPMDYYTADYKRGLQLYSSGVMIMESCETLLPDYFGFVRGVVDSPDVSLNISREMLQHDRQLKVIANNLEKKIKNELTKLLQNEREKYEKFWEAFGIQLKYSIMNAYGSNKDQLMDLLLFWSSKEKKLVSLREYRDRMPESQGYIYYAVAETIEKAASLPQAERILNAGFEVLYLTSDEDEFVFQMLQEVDGKDFLSVSDEKALPITEAEKAEVEQAEKEHKELLDFVKESLGDQVTAVRISKILKSGAVFLNSDGPISIEMEQYFKKMRSAFPMQAGRVLELNANSDAFAALRKAFDEDKEKAAQYAEILYSQALLISGLPLTDPVRYTELVCTLLR